MSITTEQLNGLGYSQAEFDALSSKMQAIVLAGLKADKTNAENEFRKIFSMGYVSNATWNQEMVSIAYLVNKQDKIDEQKKAGTYMTKAQKEKVKKKTEKGGKKQRSKGESTEKKTKTN